MVRLRRARKYITSVADGSPMDGRDKKEPGHAVIWEDHSDRNARHDGLERS